ncbi:MAG: type IIL restriction-modification enzyme MmeI, partial [Gemmatimonadota bacterium]|nr:type IIL restriction-modification enzyme MmeI [Gemmatimonadota bacterium]
YQFELPVHVINRDGSETTNFIDCWKAGHFALEAKATDTPDGNDKPLRKAFGQVRNYASQLSGTPPPFLMVVDVPRTLIVWEGRNGDWGGFPAGRRIALATLHQRPDDIRLLQDILANPVARDPRGRAQQVSRATLDRCVRGHEVWRATRHQHVAGERRSRTPGSDRKNVAESAGAPPSPARMWRDARDTR